MDCHPKVHLQTQQKIMISRFLIQNTSVILVNFTHDYFWQTELNKITLGIYFYKITHWLSKYHGMTFYQATTPCTYTKSM